MMTSIKMVSGDVFDSQKTIAEIEEILNQGTALFLKVTYSDGFRDLSAIIKIDKIESMIEFNRP